ncbi:MAG TPA: NADH:flavin oxidoreductase/NADH oxidase family protein [Aquabacterium sp.]|nr:NADH:flavin oxidoreductase/NADH oxidase family protein [Aquabacterium sp.]
MTRSSVFEPLPLAGGRPVSNRIAKAAMEEGLGDASHRPSDALIRLYERWSAGGAGMLISGNVMIDRRAMTGPGGVVLEDATELPRFAEWARAGRCHGAQFWMQINHPGRQVFADMGQVAWAPSAVPLQMGAMSRMFALPREMSERDIDEVIGRFVRTAELAEQAGFDGVEIHAAHGYLLSQFLSPLSNQRQDRWGGSLENRARILLEVVRQVRQRVSSTFGVAVKLNSADFQRGGFDVDDAKQVVLWLNELNVDFVELSGGSYEAPAMQGQTRDERTLAREAYFLDFAAQVAKVATMPLMVTGGIRRLAVAEEVRRSGVALIGIATALALRPDLPQTWARGEDPQPQLPPIGWKNKALLALATMALVRRNLHRIGAGKLASASLSPTWTVLTDRLRARRKTRQYRRWMATSGPAAGTRASAQ